MSVRIAFLGFRHSHIDELYAFAKGSPLFDVVAAAEDVAADAAKERGIELTHASVDEVLADGERYDAVAIGDYYGRRGSLAVRALEAGKHVIVDKPLCTSLDELDRIEALSDRNGLAVGCMLTNRDSGRFRTARKLMADGILGTVQTISFSGHHPLLYGTRPDWYFEEGKHGGTWNDIGIHAVDIIPVAFGLRWRRVIAARVWNSRLPEAPHFQVGAQGMFELDNEVGVLGDVSYVSPDSQGYTVPHYWRYTVHGTGGLMEFGTNLPEIRVWKDGSDGGQSIEPEADRVGGVYEDFAREVTGAPGELTTEQVIASSRRALKLQQAADNGATSVSLED